MISPSSQYFMSGSSWREANLDLSAEQSERMNLVTRLFIFSTERCPGAECMV